jgi:hypothetical protein
VPPSSVEAVETVEAVIHPAEAAEVPRQSDAPVEGSSAPPIVETPVAEKVPAQDASAA